MLLTFSSLPLQRLRYIHPKSSFAGNHFELCLHLLWRALPHPLPLISSTVTTWRVQRSFLACPTHQITWSLTGSSTTSASMMRNLVQLEIFVIPRHFKSHSLWASMRPLFNKTTILRNLSILLRLSTSVMTISMLEPMAPTEAALLIPA